MINLTVVIPVYNVEKHVRKCVDSILAQTIMPQQIILVDDGSTDSSKEICDDYASKYNNICVVHQSNQGLSAARNTGISMTKTEYITFVDSDDYISSNMYMDLSKMILREVADIAVCGVWIEQESGQKRRQYNHDEELVLSKEEALIELNSYNYFNMSFCDKIFKTNLFSNLRFPEGKLCEDYYLMHKVIARAEKIVYTSKPSYHYIQRANSISRNKTINLAPIEMSMEQLNFYNKKFPHIAYVAETACVFSHMGIYTAYIRNGRECPKELLKEIKGVAKKYLKSVVRNNHIPRIKKVQATLFCYCLPIYKYIVKRRLHR